MKKNSFTESFYKNAGYLVVVLISLVYVASSLINISKTGKSIYEIIGSGVLSLIVGTMINGVFRSIGIRRGDEDERTLSTNALHAKTVDEISPYIDKLDEFCEMENARVLREVRTRILAKEGMKYSDYFDSEGGGLWDSSAPHPPLTKRRYNQSANVAVPLPPLGKAEAKEGMKYSDYFDSDGSLRDVEGAVPYNKAMNKKGKIVLKAKKKAYFKALRVKLKPLVSSNLTSDGVSASDPFDFGKSKKEFTSQRNTSDVIVKVILAVIFGYFGVSLASEVNLASIIWNALQIVLYVTGGVIQMYNSYMWVVDDYRGSVIKKIDYLQKFKIQVKNIP